MFRNSTRPRSIIIVEIMLCRNFYSPATLVGKFRYSRDWWPVPHIVVVVAWWPTLSSPSKSCTLSEHLTPESINLGGDLAAHIKSSL